MFLETYGCVEEWISEKSPGYAGKRICVDWGEKEWVLAWQPTKCLSHTLPNKRPSFQGWQ